ncbi:molybdopterin-containing oxidoreductase family protein [Parvibacter caecicola]|mgnify:CR=1 FL=1|uniref:Molybdopterin-containing oxidoreductase family molybdopterin binding subunit n=1 Tax=Parvibacter caecicola TaxID=747645 RepID=A0A7W5GPQ4_9ACTN|nr:molybdopterin-dependent oxidoreductase [Parvibacter caecicola]MBB3171407.1 molybdopterin-containing oxidoreductase family molybdopterin binding subunit [Parvibacter caecicola]MCR2042229.1 molybdopterin-dependent oxidoreductase [Parvibacter caecicola]RNL09077.1 nitrate reductase [Parvibacter caecicola]
MTDLKSPKPGISRRSFLKATGAAAGAAALAGGGTLTALAEGGVQSQGGDKIGYSVCRGNCGSRCPMKVEVREGKVVRTSAAVLEEQDNADQRRICVKGLTQPQRVYDPDRIKYPMRRVEGTERGEGQWERVSWDDAMDEVASKMKAAFDNYGPTSVALWNSFACTGLVNGSGKGSVSYGRFLSRTGATILGPGADYAQMYLFYGALTLIFGNSGPDVPNARTIFVWGASPTDAYVQDWQFVCRAREGGTKLITIDPQFTAAAAKSDLYVPIRPGTDGAMMLAMANYIIDNGLMNEAHMKTVTVSPYLIKEDGQYAHLSDAGVAPVEMANPLTGEPMLVDPFLVWDNATGTYAAADAAADPALEGSYEVNGIPVRTVFDLTKEKIKEYTPAVAAEICDVPQETIEELARVYATEGPVYIHTNQGLGHHVNSHHNYKNLVLLASMTGNIGVPGGSLGHASLGFRSFPYNPAPMVAGDAQNLDICGMYLPDIMETKKWGDQPLDIQFLWMANGNMLCNESGRLELIEAVKKVPFVVCVDCTMTDSANYADIILPVPHAFEVEDIASLPFVPYFPYQPRLVEPLYECRTDFAILVDLANRMGITDLYDKTEEEYLHELLDTEANVANGASYNDLKEKMLVRLYDTSAVPDVDTTFMFTAPGRLSYYMDNPMPRNYVGQEIAEFERYPYYTHANEAYWENPMRDKYPLFGLGQHEKYHVHSQIAFTPWLREIEPEPMLKINSKDAEARGISQGDYVRAYNDHGSVVLRAKVTPGIKEGVVSIPHGWRADQFKEGHAQDLTNRFMNDFCSNSAFYDFLCEVERYEGSVE